MVGQIHGFSRISAGSWLSPAGFDAEYHARSTNSDLGDPFTQTFLPNLHPIRPMHTSIKVLPATRPILTVDLEDWFHLLDCDAIPEASHWDLLESRLAQNTDRLLEFFAARGLRATFFSLGWVAERHPGVLRAVADMGHEIGCHSHVHTLIHTQSPSAFAEETRRAIQTISQCVSRPVTCYRAPGFSLTPSTLWAFDHLADLGITTDCSVFPGHHAHGGTANHFPEGPFRILTPSGQEIGEIPMTLARLGPMDLAFAGGGFFRFLPFSLIAHWTRTHPGTMTYFHPRDFDAGQPRIPGLSALRRFKTYAGLPGAATKLERFLDLFGGQSLSEACTEICWETRPVVRL